MHLWPTRKLRDSWSVSSVSRVERTMSKMRAKKRAETALRQKLLEAELGKAKVPTFTSLNISCESWLWRLFKDFVFALTCCCCFGGVGFVPPMKEEGYQIEVVDAARMLPILRHFLSASVVILVCSLEVLVCRRRRVL